MVSRPSSWCLQVGSAAVDYKGPKRFDIFPPGPFLASRSGGSSSKAGQQTCTYPGLKWRVFRGYESQCQVGARRAAVVQNEHVNPLGCRSRTIAVLPVHRTDSSRRLAARAASWTCAELSFSRPFRTCFLPNPENNTAGVETNG